MSNHSIRKFSDKSSSVIYERTGMACRWSRFSVVERNGRKYVRAEGPGIDRLYDPTLTVLTTLAVLCIENGSDEGVTIGEAGEKIVARYREWKAKQGAAA